MGWADVIMLAPYRPQHPTFLLAMSYPHRYPSLLAPGLVDLRGV